MNNSYRSQLQPAAHAAAKALVEQEQAAQATACAGLPRSASLAEPGLPNWQLESSVRHSVSHWQGLCFTAKVHCQLEAQGNLGHSSMMHDYIFVKECLIG